MDACDLKAAFPSRLHRVFLVAALLIAVATVYGRYHYMADATCVAAVATLGAVLCGIWKLGKNAATLQLDSFLPSQTERLL